MSLEKKIDSLLSKYINMYINDVSKKLGVSRSDLTQIWDNIVKPEEKKKITVKKQCQYIFTKGKNLNQQCSLNATFGNMCSKHKGKSVAKSQPQEVEERVFELPEIRQKVGADLAVNLPLDSEL